MSAFNLYASDAGRSMEVDLGHGFRGQPRYPGVFRAEHLIAPIWQARGGEAVFAGSRALVYARFIRAARAWLREHAVEYDVFHGLTGYAYTVDPALAAAKAGIPAVIKIAAYRRDLAEKGALQRITGRIRRRRASLHGVSAVVAISSRIRSELLGYGISEEKIAYIPNGVDIARFSPVTDQQERSNVRSSLGVEDRFTIVLAASLVARKRPDVVVAALAKMQERGTDAQLLLAGPEHEPSFTADLRRRVQRLGLEDRVHWLGMVRDMASVYRAADVFCLPSRVEGLANSLLEAMATGLPVLVEPISGNEDVVTADTGLLVRGGVEEYATAMQRYHDDPALLELHGRQARQRILGRFDSRTVVAAHQRLFENMIRGGEAADASISLVEHGAEATR